VACWRGGAVAEGRGSRSWYIKRVSFLKSVLPTVDPGDLVAHRWRKKLCTKGVTRRRAIGLDEEHPSRGRANRGREAPAPDPGAKQQGPRRPYAHGRTPAPRGPPEAGGAAMGLGDGRGSTRAPPNLKSTCGRQKPHHADLPFTPPDGRRRQSDYSTGSDRPAIPRRSLMDTRSGQPAASGAPPARVHHRPPAARSGVPGAARPAGARCCRFLATSTAISYPPCSFKELRMRRREFITGSEAWPLAARGDEGALHRSPFDGHW
jgi:hypothetical protein